MKIGVDIRVLMDRHYSGISEYTANLLLELLKQDKTNDYYLFYNSWHNIRERFRYLERENVKIVSTSWPNKFFNYALEKFLAWPKIDKILSGVDLFWSPHFNFSSFSSGPTSPRKVITIHDLSFLSYPEFFSLRQNIWHYFLGVKKTLQAADQIIAASENTKNDLMELAHIPESKIKLIYAGNNSFLGELKEEDINNFLNKNKLQQDFILYLGNIEPRKNIVNLIKAFDILRSKRKDYQLKLVLAGARAWKNRKINLAWKSSPYYNDIVFLNYVSPSEKEILYNKAKVFVYPSFYEGFGFPPLEAMSHDLPVVCSNVSSLPEVVGQGGLLINPFKAQEIAEAVGLILDDKDLREKLIKIARQQAAKFTWSQTAHNYLTLFTDICVSSSK